MTGRVPSRVAALTGVALLAGCAYYNALYNARRLYDVAEDAAARGQVTAAEAAHRESLEKAARSLERDPDGRWADDALLLVGQNQLALGNCQAADAALRRVLRESSDADLAARARVYLGAASYCLENPAEAAVQLDAAMSRLERGSAIEAYARLWRARTRFELGGSDSAWADLAQATARDDAIGRAALLEQIGRAIEGDRPDAAIEGFHRLLANPDGDLHGDSIRRLADAAAVRWDGARAREALEPAPQAPWSGEVRDLMIVERAGHAAAAGDTALAIRELETAASRSSVEVANRARILIARLRLATLSDPAELEDVRRVLLPAVAEQSVRPVIQAIGVVGALLEQARLGQPLALFAAAEVARDRLGAPELARNLFVGYVSIGSGGAWATKAALAALQLDPPADEAAQLRQRLASANDVYAVASRGATPEGFEDSEVRLDQVLSGLLARASDLVQQRDIAVGEAIAEFDSITSAVRADSLALACGLFADSVGLAGIRRDSVSAACMRADTLLVDSFLVVDTTALRDSTVVTPEAPRPQREQPEAEF